MEQLNAAQPVIEQCNHIPQLLSIKDVGHYTGLSRSTIYEMINAIIAQKASGIKFRCPAQGVHSDFVR